MENKINIAEILRNCPQGMELDCTISNDVVFEKIEFGSTRYPVVVRKLDTGISIFLTKYGQYVDDKGYKCVIFPKGKTTWEGFVPPYKFKVGDNIRIKGQHAMYVVTELREDRYMLDYKDLPLLLKNQDQWELVPDKFDITTLVPFESKVLVRDVNDDDWDGEIFTRYAHKSFNNCNFVTLGGRRWKQCIPYEGNEHLLGTKDNCDEFYKIW